MREGHANPDALYKMGSGKEGVRVRALQGAGPLRLPGRGIGAGLTAKLGVTVTGTGMRWVSAE